jgi:hypothetical protein
MGSSDEVGVLASYISEDSERENKSLIRPKYYLLEHYAV